MSMKNFNKTMMRSASIANRCREVKQWKNDGPIFMRASNDATVGNLYIYSVIGDSWWDDTTVSATKVKEALAALKGVKTLNIFINSEGGDVFEAKAIYTQLKRFDSHKVVYVDGIAASAATFVAMAGDEIITSPIATWMVHEAWTVAFGDASAMRDTADLLDLLNTDIANCYAERTGRKFDEVREMMRVETWMSADEALKQKFTDKVESFDKGDEEVDEEKVDNKFAKRVSAGMSTTRERIAAMQPTLLEYRAKRAKEDHPIVEEKKTTQNNDRASTVKRANAPASRS